MASEHTAELGMQTVPSLNIAYTQEKGYVTADIADKENLTKLNLSGAQQEGVRGWGCRGWGCSARVRVRVQRLEQASRWSAGCATC